MGFFKNVKKKVTGTATKALLKSQMKKQGADDEQIELISQLIDENPELFEGIAREVEERTKNGEDQMKAAQSVMMKHMGQLQQMMAKDPKMMQKMRVQAMKEMAKQRKK